MLGVHRARALDLRGIPDALADTSTQVLQEHCLLPFSQSCHVRYKLQADPQGEDTSAFPDLHDSLRKKTSTPYATTVCLPP